MNCKKFKLKVISNVKEDELFPVTGLAVETVFLGKTCY